MARIVIFLPIGCHQRFHFVERRHMVGKSVELAALLAVKAFAYSIAHYGCVQIVIRHGWNEKLAHATMSMHQFVLLHEKNNFAVISPDDGHTAHPN